MHADERKLIAAFRAGDPAAFDTLYARYGGRVLAFARHLTPTSADAEDLTQDVFIAAFQGAEGFREQARLLTWLLSIVVRRWRDQQRRPRPPTVPYTEQALSERPAPPAGAQRDFAGQTLSALALQEALTTLDASLRQAFLLVAVQGLTHREAAEILERPVGTVKWRVAEATRRLRYALQETEGKEKHDVSPLYS